MEKLPGSREARLQRFHGRWVNQSQTRRDLKLCIELCKRPKRNPHVAQEDQVSPLRVTFGDIAGDRYRGLSKLSA